MSTYTLSNFTLLTTGADGGHHYITTQIEYEGHIRNITAFFKHKSDEKLLAAKTELTVKGELIDEGLHQALLILDAEIVV